MATIQLHPRHRQRVVIIHLLRLPMVDIIRRPPKAGIIHHPPKVGIIRRPPRVGIIHLKTRRIPLRLRVITPPNKGHILLPLA